MRLCPFALDYATHLWNHLPAQHRNVIELPAGVSPIEICSGSQGRHNALKHAKTWGSPSCVLDPRLQDSKKIPKWEPRARRGQFKGVSFKHASNIGMIRNLTK